MNAMFREIVALQWKVSRWAVAVFVLLGFGIPMLAMQVLGQVSGPAAGLEATTEFVLALRLWNPLFPALAAVMGFTFALTAWNWDHKTGHVYALALPVTRWEYALHKFAAGALVLLIPAAALWIGALAGTALTRIPEPLQAYPHALGIRFLLAALIVYAAAFALAAGTMRTTVILILSVLAFLIFGTLLVGWVEQLFGVEIPLVPFDLLEAALLRWPGPFHVFGGNWSLVDV